MAWRRPGDKPLSEPIMVSLLTHICVSRPQWVNSLSPGRSECDSKYGIFNLVLLIGIFRSSHDNALGWMPQDLTDDKSTLVQVMAWCFQATSHYLDQCWLSPLSPYGITLGHNELMFIFVVVVDNHDMLLKRQLSDWWNILILMLHHCNGKKHIINTHIQTQMIWYDEW